MKKLKLKMLELGTTQMLTRDQLKNVVGGAIGSGITGCYMCCSQVNDNLCGRCDTSGTGGCLGNGKAWPCFCY